jgi:hypothetical protein
MITYKQKITKKLNNSRQTFNFDKIFQLLQIANIINLNGKIFLSNEKCILLDQKRNNITLHFYRSDFLFLRDTYKIREYQCVWISNDRRPYTNFLYVFKYLWFWDLVWRWTIVRLRRGRGRGCRLPWSLRLSTSRGAAICKPAISDSWCKECSVRNEEFRGRTAQYRRFRSPARSSSRSELRILQCFIGLSFGVLFLWADCLYLYYANGQLGQRTLNKPNLLPI